ncbi:MAG: hypothetical protein J0H68_04190 [Sphingobacteriia bacterium]|nr:hypothetical protein [Sphingobacteriia bacterium]
MKFIYLLLSIFISSLAFAEEDLNIMGPATVKSGKYNNISIMGPSTIKNVTAIGFTNITGNSEIYSSNFEIIEIVGPSIFKDVKYTDTSIIGTAKFNNVTSKGKTKIIGLLVMNSSEGKDLEVVSEETTINDSKIENLKVLKNNNKKDQKVIIKGKTKINNIIFESGTGVIEVYGDAQISGQVTGAIVVKK